MFDLIFFAKTIVITVAIVLLMQIRIGDLTLEDRAHFWLRNSSVTLPVQTAAEGGAKFIRNVLNRFTVMLSPPHQTPAKRGPDFNWQRSQSYQNEQQQKAKDPDQQY